MIKSRASSLTSHPSHPHTPVHRLALLKDASLQRESSILYIPQSYECNSFNKHNKTFNNGSLGSRIDEERSEMR